MIKKILSSLLWSLIALLFVAACGAGGGYSGGSSSSSGGSSGASCSTGYCLNNGQCCPRATPDYTYGGHGYSAGCYARCPYVGDCGSSTQCF